MLPKNLKLSYFEIRALRRKGKRLRSKNLTVFIQKDKTDNFRWIIHTPKKTQSLASDRNRTKRIVSEAIKELTPQIKTGGKGLVWIEKKDVNQKTQQVKQLLTDMLNKEGML